MTAGHILTRTFTWLLGLSAVAWGGLEFPLFWQQAAVHHVAFAILRGETFKQPLLVDEVRQAEAVKQASFCHPPLLRDAAVIRLALMDDALASKDKTLVASAYRPLYDATLKALSCAPTDSFAWLTLFWLDLINHGLTPANIGYLRMSYALGPNEGWVALRRSRLAIALFAQLPLDLADDAADEFVKLVDSEAVNVEAAAIFARAAPAVQRRLAAALKSAKPVPRQIFADTLADAGVDVDIPGVQKRPPRPFE